MKKMEALNNKILKAVECLAAILMASIAVMILIQVLSRGLRIGLQWPDEMSRFAYVALVFLGNIVAVSRKKNITITLLLDYLPGTARKIFDVAIDILTLLFGLFAMKGSILLRGACQFPCVVPAELSIWANPVLSVFHVPGVLYQYHHGCAAR